MLMESISAGVPQAMAHAIAFSLMMGSASKRFFSERALESARISNGKSDGRTTAAAHTGPAKGPLPASSAPTMRL